MRKKVEQQKRAREMRAEGMALKEIAETLGVAKSSVSMWVRGVELTPEQKSALKARQSPAMNRYAGANSNRLIAMEKRKQAQDIGREQARQGSRLHLIGCMLYWSEGAKKRNRVHFVNSDVKMMLLFMRFLREELDVSNEGIVMYIHCYTHDPNEIKRIEWYWLDLLKLPDSCMRKTHVKKGGNSRNNILKNGICTISVYRIELAMQIYGAIQEYGGFNNPDLLF